MHLLNTPLGVSSRKFCPVIKPRSYESTQNSALFHSKLIKSTLHQGDTFFNCLNVSITQSMVLLLQDCTIFGVSSLNNESRFPTTRLSSSNAMDYHCEIFVRTYSKPGGYLYALHAYIRPSSSTFPLAGAVANCTCPCGRE